MFASWNKDSLFYNQTVNQPDWILNPIVHEYDGLTQTLETIGYQKNKDYYLFNYDWRKGLNSLADDFNIYLNQNVFPQHTNETVNIAGHSLGGLVGRVYLQKYYPNNIGKLLTLGSPHQGAAQTYKAVEAGELDIDNSFFWLAQKIILQLNKDGLKTDKQIISEKLPVVKDLLPTYNFLTDQNNQLISVNSMQVKNDTLLNYLPDFPNLFLNLQSFYGEKGSTTAGYKITARTLYDQLFDFYPDGRPTATNYSQGDYLITSLSANAGNNSIKINNFDHGEIVYKKEAIKKILDSLSINYQENQIIEGQSTQILPSLIFLVLSPASLEVEFNGQTYTENQGMVFIENAQNGNYIIKAKGNSLGRYTIVAGQLTQSKDIWSKIEGEITTNPPSSQTDSYTLNFNSNVIDQTSISSISQLFDELIIYLTDQNKTLKNSDTTKAINNLQIGKNYYLQNNSGRQKSILQIIHQQLFLGRSKLSLADKPKLIYAIEKLENLYNRSLYGYNFGTIPSRLKITLESYKKNILPAQQYLLSQKNLDKNTINNSLILLTIDNKLKLAEENYLKGNYNLTEIYLKSVNELLKEVRKI